MNAAPREEEVGAAAALRPSVSAVAGKSAASPDSVLRDLVEALIVAIVLSLTIKQFAAEAYKVPTGSMEPTIHGDPEHGDRILIDRLTYLLRDPRRFEVVVFRYPNNRRIYYLKRVIGLPNETVFLLGGDVYTAPFGSTREDPIDLWAKGRLEIQRKPAGVQSDVFDRYPQILDPNGVTPRSEEDFLRWWRVSNAEGVATWDFDGGAVADAEELSLAVLRRGVTDALLDAPPGADTGAHGKYQVGDQRVRVTAEPLREGGVVVFRLREVHHRLELSARVPVRGAAEPGGLFVDGRRVADYTGPALEPGRSYELTFVNVDDALTIAIDGCEVARALYDHEPPRRDMPFEAPADETAFGVEAARVRFTSAQVWRDVFYRRGTVSWADVPAGSYFMLGDNSGASKDSREWARTTIRIPSLGDLEVSGDAEAVIDPTVLDSRLPNPFERDGRRWFVDEFGNVRDITDEGFTPSTREMSPLVSRELIQGRAFAIFWPWDRIGVVR